MTDIEPDTKSAQQRHQTPAEHGDALLPGEADHVELRESRDRFRTLFHANPIPSAIIRLEDLTYLDVNEVYLAYFGLTREKVVGQQIDNTAQWGDDATRHDLMATYVRDGRLHNHELKIELPDGRIRTVLASDTPLELDGRPCTLATFIDITDRKESEERVREHRQALEAANAELAAARDRFRTLFQINPVPSSITQMDDMIYLDVNQAYLDYFGLTREQVVGHSMLNRTHWPDEEARQATLEQFRALGTRLTAEYVIRLPNGDQRTVLTSNASLELEGHPCTLATFIDITTQKQAEAEIRRLASELTLAEHAERQRISGILHDDLQQRLYALQVLVVAAQANGSAPAELATIADGLRQAGELTRRLSVDMTPPILRGESLYHALIWLGSKMKEQFGLTVKVTLTTPWRMLDEGLRIVLFQVVRELLFNVVKHAGAHEATVTLQQVDDNVVIEVRDEGAGFDAADALAQMNGRAHGLGMAQQRMALYGGRVEVSAAPGRGTTAVITVPAHGHYRQTEESIPGDNNDDQDSAGR